MFLLHIECKVFIYYLLCLICGTLDLKEIVSLSMTSFLVGNSLCAAKLSVISFSIIY